MPKNKRMKHIESLLKDPTDDNATLTVLVRDISESVGSVFQQFLLITPNSDLRFAVCSAFVMSGLAGVIEEHGLEKAKALCKELLETDLWKFTVMGGNRSLN